MKPEILFLWKQNIVAKLERRGIAQAEWEEVYRGGGERHRSRSSDRPMLFGATAAGRQLAIVFEDEDLVDGVLYVEPVTAFDA